MDREALFLEAQALPSKEIWKSLLATSSITLKLARWIFATETTESSEARHLITPHYDQREAHGFP